MVFFMECLVLDGLGDVELFVFGLFVVSYLFIVDFCVCLNEIVFVRVREFIIVGCSEVVNGV